MTVMIAETVERALYVVGEGVEDGPACWLDLIWSIDGDDGISGRVAVLLGQNYYSEDSAVAISAVRRAWLEPDESEVLRPKCDRVPIVSGWIEVGGHRMSTIDAAVTVKDRAVIAKVSDEAVVALLEVIAEGGLPALGLRIEGDQADRVYRFANPVGRRTGAEILAQVNVWRWRTGRSGGVAPAPAQPNESGGPVDGQRD